MINYYNLLEGISELSVGMGPPSALEYWMGPNAVRTVLNSNFGRFKDFVNIQEASVEQSNALLFGSGVYSGMIPSIGSGLHIDVTDGTCLIGFLFEYAGGSILVPDDYNPGYMFFCQDGTWHIDNDNTAPTDTESFLFLDFVSSGGSVTSINLTSRNPYKILPCQVRSVSGSFDTVIPVNGPIEMQINHSTSLAIPGFITVESSSEDIDVEHCYPERDTPTSFWIRMQFNQTEFYSYYADYLGDWVYDGYTYYSAEPTTISYTRTGLSYY